MGVLTDYPFNLLDELVSESDDMPIFEGTQDQLDGLDYALSTLYEREHKVLLLRYKSGKTLEETGREFNVTRERIRQNSVSQEVYQMMCEERDAAVNDLSLTNTRKFNNPCEICKHNKEKCEPVDLQSVCCKWEWRGLQKEK